MARGPNVDPEPETQPNELPPDAKLEAGYIRYVRIIPKEGPNGEICLETCIRRARPDDRPSEGIFYYSLGSFYSAISYAWGDPTPLHPIIVDGKERLIAKNLWYFLQRTNKQRMSLPGTKAQRDEDLWLNTRGLFSSKMEPPFIIRGSHHLDEAMKGMADLQRRGWPEDWLWIDALCIDQADTEERTHQVQIMSKIFGKADQVICWLGPMYDNSEHAMTTMTEYGQHAMAVMSEYGEHSVPYNEYKFPFHGRTELSEAIYSLCERPYWKRLWVFQELEHAKHIRIMCGDKTILWTDFENVWRLWGFFSARVDTFARGKDESERFEQSLATRMMALRRKPMEFSLFNLLMRTEHLECSDWRDRVYALLSVATMGHEDIEADYRVSKITLATRILLNQFAGQTKRYLNDISWCCQFVSSVLRMSEAEYHELFDVFDEDGQLEPTIQGLRATSPLKFGVDKWPDHSS